MYGIDIAYYDSKVPANEKSELIQKNVIIIYATNLMFISRSEAVPLTAAGDWVGTLYEQY